MAKRPSDAGTLTRAEEEALARARDTVRRASAGRAPASRRDGGSTRARSRSGPGSRTRRTRPPARLVSVDLLRGAAIVASAVALSAVAPAEVPPWARSAAWHGYTLADLLLPLFLLTAGVSLAYAEVANRERTPWQRTGRMLRRVVVLVGLGIGLSWLADPDLATLRWTGLLPRIALATLLAWAVARTSRRVQGLAIAAVLLGWVYALERVAVPGLGQPAMAPDANLARWLDLEVLGAAHVTAPTDPFGLVTTLPAAVVVLAGVLAGRWLRSRPIGPATGAALVVAGAWLTVVATATAQVHPLNATLWTTPYVLFTVGAGLALLGFSYLVAEVAGLGLRLGPLRTLGANPLVAYATIAAPIAWASRGAAEGSSTWDRLVEAFFGPLFGGWSGVVVGLVLVAVALRVTRWLERRGWTLRA